MLRETCVCNTKRFAGAPRCVCNPCNQSFSQTGNRMVSPGAQTMQARTGAAKGRKAPRASPAWYRAVETAYFISDQRQVLLLPGSPASTLLYSSDLAAQEQMWSWWYKNAWLSASTFDK